MLHTNTNSSSYPGIVGMPQDLRVLLLDDSNFDRARIKRLSQKTKMGIHMDEVDSIAAMDVAVARENYDLILIDYRLPEGDGMQALEHVMRTDLNKDAGKIMITGDGSRNTALQAMRGGYHDFLSKDDMDVDGLRNAMMNALSVARERQHMILQTLQQTEIIRQGLLSALKDSEVQGNVVSLLRENMIGMGAGNDTLRNRFDIADMDSFLAGLGDEDEFIFH
ncbi:Response regulator/GGDEF domain protein [Sulfitobacter noctilucae]|uniref:response regulator n=1 Tax=Sulfitobacter noctilucae TaxID=1342302 RepID=UPI000468BB83|nr:response regulator [Sulfitobacter noctilucae]KIN70788.1 Response regulator/GGDEF domain protein [Sulfitobacter noctilucae]